MIIIPLINNNIIQIIGRPVGGAGHEEVCLLGRAHQAGPWFGIGRRGRFESALASRTEQHTPNLPTKMIPAKTPWLKLVGKFPMDMGIPPHNIKILLESNPLKSRILVRGLAVASMDTQRA